MTWNKTDFVLRKRMHEHGLNDLVSAGQLCRHAESLLPNIFTAVSVKNQVMHLEVPRTHLLAFKMQEGRILDELNQHATLQKVAPISRFRLTIM
jgi:hypothetical protein